ncbi:RnfABCDGE type electron transport complex subunit C [Candidatus Bipolaricaulota bacterium]|nr:RnfABCDGE type electron transport complex subunit C [Candidatus Bipolaricaulota bacterium]
MRLERYRERGGFYLDARLKRGLEEVAFSEVPPPPECLVFLRQHLGPAGRPAVKEGERVHAGQKLTQNDHPLGVPVHSPVTGRVVEIRTLPHPMSGQAEPALVIRTEDEERPKPADETNPEKLSPQEIVSRIREAGVVGMGGAGYPTHAKLQQGRGARYLLINAKESDINVACDVRILRERPQAVVEGIAVLARALGEPEVVVAVRLQPHEIPEFTEQAQRAGFRVVPVRLSYSLGSERLLVREVLGREVPLGKYPPDVGVVVHNVFTAYAAGQAVRWGLPVVSRGLTFWSQTSGGRNLWVRVGTPVRHLLSFLGIEENRFSRFVFGSAMMGWAFAEPTIPVVKTTTGIMGLEHGETSPFARSLPCIRCGFCDQVCPVRIYPSLILAAVKAQDVRALKRLHLEACIECGLCSYVCPARILFTPELRRGKQLLNKAAEP